MTHVQSVSGQWGTLASVLLGSQADVSSLCPDAAGRDAQGKVIFTRNHVKLKEGETSLQFAVGGSAGEGKKALQILWESLRLLFGVMKSSQKLS